MKEFLGGVKKAILVGGGFVGLETGGALLRSGIKVAVIEHNPRILPRQMDSEGARILQGKMGESMGFSFFLNGQSEEILGENTAWRECVLKTGQEDGRRPDGWLV